MRARHAFFLTPGPPNLRAIGAMARRRQSKRCEGRVRGRGYSRRGHGPGEKARAHLSRWCVSAPQAAGEGARRARVPGGAQPGRSLGRGAKSAPRLVSAVLAAPAVGPEGGERDDRGVCRVKAAVGRGRFPRGGREVGRTGCEGPADGARCRACTGRSRGVVRVTTLEREDHRRASAGWPFAARVRRGFPRRESLISGGDGCETSLNAHNTVYRVLITVKLYYVVVVFFVYHLSLFPGGGALKFIGFGGET